MTDLDELRAEIKRLNYLVDAYGDLMDAIFDWLGSDSKQDQERAMVQLASKAHEVHQHMREEASDVE